MEPPADPTANDVPMASALDLDAVAEELAAVEVALERLESGTYWTCEVTGGELTDELLARDPVARRLPPPTTPDRPPPA